MSVEDLVQNIGEAVEVAGVAVIVVGALVATGTYAMKVRAERDAAYQTYRQTLGRAILLGLEFLVAGDIIGTVAIDPSFTSLGILGGIVLIRTFLSFSLGVELTGKWPWQHKLE